MITVQLLTHNNQATIQQTLDSVSSLEHSLIIGDFGSTDDTVKMCRKAGATVLQVSGLTRSQARNLLGEKSGSGPHLRLEPWETVIKGHRNLANTQGPAYVKVLQNKTLTKELRLWSGQLRFSNPVFEQLDITTETEADIVLHSLGRPYSAELLSQIEAWKKESPLAPQPYYYQACLLLEQRRYDDFLKVIDHYLFLDKSASVAATMGRYYCALTLVIHKRLAKPALQHLNLCLCVNPLMAEFWCLTGDVNYHLLNRFDHAREFYENAIILGGRRLKTDKWPMDITKYGEYPRKMIDSCNQILGESKLAINMMTNIPQLQTT